MSDDSLQKVILNAVLLPLVYILYPKLIYFLRRDDMKIIQEILLSDSLLPYYCELFD